MRKLDSELSKFARITSFTVTDGPRSCFRLFVAEFNPTTLGHNEQYNGLIWNKWRIRGQTYQFDSAEKPVNLICHRR